MRRRSALRRASWIAGLKRGVSPIAQQFPRRWPFRRARLRLPPQRDRRLLRRSARSAAHPRRPAAAAVARARPAGSPAIPRRAGTAFLSGTVKGRLCAGAMQPACDGAGSFGLEARDAALGDSHKVYYGTNSSTSVDRRKFLIEMSFLRTKCRPASKRFVAHQFGAEPLAGPPRGAKNPSGCINRPE